MSVNHNDHNSVPEYRQTYINYGSCYAPAASGIGKRGIPRCRRQNFTVLRQNFLLGLHINECVSITWLSPNCDVECSFYPLSYFSFTTLLLLTAAVFMNLFNRLVVSNTGYLVSRSSYSSFSSCGLLLIVVILRTSSTVMLYHAQLSKLFSFPLVSFVPLFLSWLLSLTLCLLNVLTLSDTSITWISPTQT